MKPIAADLGTPRSAAALAASLALIGAGVGGIFMGWLSERIGPSPDRHVRRGDDRDRHGDLASGGLTALYIGHGVFMGLLGASCMMSPIMTYVTRWFDRRRGTAIALISSGQYIAGVIWPGTFQFTVTEFGWRQSMLFYAVVVALLVVPLAWIFLRPPPEVPLFGASHHGPPKGTPVSGLRPNVAFWFVLFRDVLLLHDHVDADAAHRVALLGSWHRTGTRRRDAFRAAWLRVRRASVLGLAVGPDRRHAHHFIRFYCASDSDDRISADAG